MLACGAVLGMAGVAVPAVEAGIAASVVVLALLVVLLHGAGIAVGPARRLVRRPAACPVIR